MTDFFINNNFFQPTADISQPAIAEDQIEARAVFSINASNELEGTAWIVKNGQHSRDNLGPLSYNIKNKDGVSIGISQSSINPDAAGLYKLNAISAFLLQDLTHYTVEIQALFENKDIYGVVAITLGE